MCRTSCWVLLAFLSSWSWNLQPAKDAPKPASDGLVSTWGATVSSIRLTAGGYMIDFRYKVLDPEKAAPLGRRENKAYRVDESTGAKFLVPTTPKVGSLRQAPKKLDAGKTYFVFFCNPGKYLKAGSTVTVVIGDFRAEHLVLE